jgi:hypothetical protein
MKAIFFIVILLFFCRCQSRQEVQDHSVELQSTSTDTSGNDNKVQIQFTDEQLEAYLDSVGNLSSEQLADKAAYVSDSIFKNQLQLNKLISDRDFSVLKRLIKEEPVNPLIDISTAKNIFGQLEVDSSYLEKEQIPLTVFTFDKHGVDLNEFAICLGYPDAGWSTKLFFFKGKRIISQHVISHRYGLKLKHYKDSDGRTVIYYKENFGSGSGIWQFNFYFYKYYGDKLLPSLNVLQNGNLQSPWGARIFWFEAAVVKTAPLTLKMVYYQELYDTSGGVRRIIDDSTLVKYDWNEEAKELTGDYRKSKISTPQIASYFLGDNELLFINAYYSTLKDWFSDKRNRRVTLEYLNEVKNHYER